MKNGKNRMIMFHGTSDAFLKDILEHGMSPAPDRKLSAAMAGGDGHTVSMPGAYFTADRSGASHYSAHAARHFGGQPIIICASIDVSRLVPDEDEVLYSLGWPITLALGYDMNEDTQVLAPWTMTAAREAVRLFLNNDPQLAGRTDLGAPADRLHGLLAPVLGESWDRSPELVCPDYNTDGWSSPEWVRKLTESESGMAFYRREMDGFCRMLAGMDPDCYPAGIESCKGRIVEPVMVDGPDGGCFIAGIGSLDEPAFHFDAFGRLTGEEDVYPDWSGFPVAWSTPKAA